MGYNGYTEKKKASNERYLAKAKLKMIPFRVRPEEKQEIERRAREAGKSVNQFIKDAVLS